METNTIASKILKKWIYNDKEILVVQAEDKINFFIKIKGNVQEILTENIEGIPLNVRNKLDVLETFLANTHTFNPKF